MTSRTSVELVPAGLATAHAERIIAGSRKFEVARMRITEQRDDACSRNRSDD
jgi:hypothetical protein